MSNIDGIRRTMQAHGWFDEAGAYVLFDGQFGSTGKGLLASVIAEAMGHQIDCVTTNAGPNSGHTAYVPGTGEKVMTQQIPVSSVMMSKMGMPHACTLNGGAVIDPGILDRELSLLGPATVSFWLHWHAALIKPSHQGDQLSHVASTGKGVGPAMVTKLGRTSGAVVGNTNDMKIPTMLKRHGGNFYGSADQNEPWRRTFVETAQGWSLGINSGFYPYVTSRECSVSQALADAGIAPRDFRKSIVSLRTYPIRVANHPDGGSSGPCYPDQREISFEDLGVEPELTTVTQRVRRIFTWSDGQFRQMLYANRPDALFINFMNYLPDEQAEDVFLENMLDVYVEVMGHGPDFVLGGYGPYNSDVRVLA